MTGCLNEYAGLISRSADAHEIGGERERGGRERWRERERRREGEEGEKSENERGERGREGKGGGEKKRGR